MENDNRKSTSSPSATDSAFESCKMSEAGENIDKQEGGEQALYMNILFSILDGKTVKQMVANQRATQRKYEETNQMLTSFNDLSEERFMQLNDEFKNHTKTLIFLRKDLEIIFRRIRTLKARLSEKYPEAFEATAPVVAHLREKYLEEQERLNSSSINQSEKTNDDDVINEINVQSNDKQEQEVN